MADAEVKKSILLSTKKYLGLEPEYDPFDLELEMFINSTLARLTTLGVGPQDQPYQIEGPENEWDEYLLGDANLAPVKLILFYSAKLNFDPPDTSFGITAMEKRLAEEEWRINVYMEGKRHGIA